MRTIIALGLLLAACRPAPLGPSPADPLGATLDPGEVRGLVGSTGIGTRSSTHLTNWGMYVSPDGRLIGPDNKTGTWTITDDGQFCMHWVNDFDGQETCQTVHQDPDGRIALHSPTAVEHLLFTPGNHL